MIWADFGLQGSGKTLYGICLSRYLKEIYPNARLYTNIPEVEGFRHITKISQIPIDLESKIIYLDEAMFTLDSRLFSNTNSIRFTKFMAYLRKINACFGFATHHPKMVDVRLRMQMNYCFFHRATDKYFEVMVVNNYTNEKKVLSIKKSNDLFSFANYDTRAFADIVDVDIELKTGKSFKVI